MTAQSNPTLFKPLDGAAGGNIEIWFNGQPLTVPAGRSVAAALLAAGVARFRATPVSGAPRAPYCMMGACFECLVEIDGVPSRQSCMVEVKAGMRVRSQEGARDLPPSIATDIPLENAHGR
ncbi:NAD(FAD)-dependent dehydrogenase [Caballeronia pedi]|uniref:NAD(FAD)-dependent dehydrogenase n=1 Tax=Caballeronia pedi TaxID=1777141 RepID=A0A158CFJ6_9BURK|nr:(2Fe-2S)-binding protein [Caballeronia pedi]SAK81085.1 NAD(FAD)-dependent dehydrogenase [Caballeronia pedi]